MSQELKKTIKDNLIKYENEEYSIVFSHNKSPMNDSILIGFSGVCNITEREGFKNVPVSVFWGEEAFMQLVRDLGFEIKRRI